MPIYTVKMTALIFSALAAIGAEGVPLWLTFLIVLGAGIIAARLTLLKLRDARGNLDRTEV